MVHNIHGLVQLLNNDDEYISKKAQKEDNTVMLYHSLKNLTIHELIEIAIGSKNKEQREMAVHILGSKGSSKQEILNKLWEITTYDHSSIKKAAYWSLAKLNDKKVIPFLLDMLDSSISLFEKSVTMNLLGKIGIETTIRPLVNLSALTKDKTTISAGLAIHQITNRIGLKPLIDLLQDVELLIRQEVIWILSARVRFLSNTYERMRILKALKNQLTTEENQEMKAIIAFNLSTLNILEGSKELLLMCINKSIPEYRASSFWNEVVRAFIYRQKEASLKLVNKSLDALKSGNLHDNEAKKTQKNLKKIKKTLMKLDKIFEIE
jgi:hypothetical protein